MHVVSLTVSSYVFRLGLGQALLGIPFQYEGSGAVPHTESDKLSEHSIHACLWCNLVTYACAS